MRIAFALMVFGCPLFACTAYPVAIERAYQVSAVIATVTVTEIVEITPGYGQKTKVRVDEAWKGTASGADFEVHDGSARRSCPGIKMEKGGQYLLYAGSLEDGTLFATDWRTRSMHFAAFDLAYLSNVRAGNLFPKLRAALRTGYWYEFWRK